MTTGAEVQKMFADAVDVAAIKKLTPEKRAEVLAILAKVPNGKRRR